MSGTLTHSPANVLRSALVDLGLGTMPTDQGVWPAYYSQEPDKPDNSITLYDTVGRKQGRTQIDGEVQEAHGTQIRIRSSSQITGFTKARAIAIGFDQSIRRTSVTISSTDYVIHGISRVGEVISLGTEPTPTKRFIFTINVTATIRQIT